MERKKIFLIRAILLKRQNAIFSNVNLNYFLQVISVLYDNYDLEESDHENYSEFHRVAELLIGRELLQGAFQLYPWTSSVWHILVETAEVCL